MRIYKNHCLFNHIKTVSKKDSNTLVLKTIDSIYEIKELIDNDRKMLAGEFCRGCGYCMPCPVGIEINNCARMSLLLRRSPSELQLTPAVQAKMKKIENCLHCNQCKSNVLTD